METREGTYQKQGSHPRAPLVTFVTSAMGQLQQIRHRPASATSPAPSARLAEIGSDLGIWLTTTGDLERATDLHSAVTRLCKNSQPAEQLIDIAVEWQSWPQVAEAFSEWLGAPVSGMQLINGQSLVSTRSELAGFPVRLTFRHLLRPPVRVLAYPVPALLICVFTEAQEQSEHFGPINAVSEDVLLTTAFPGPPDLVEVSASDNKLMIARAVRFADFLPAVQLSTIIDLLSDFSLATNLQHLCNCAQSIVSRELDGMRAHRAVVQKQLNRLQTRSNAQLGTSTTVQDAVQKLTQIEAQSSERYQQFVRSGENSVEGIFETYLTSIEGLASQKGPKGLTVFLDPTSVTTILESVRQNLRMFFETEISYLHTIAKDTRGSVVNSVSAASFSGLEPARIAKERVDTMLGSHLTIRKSYRGEVATQGVMQLIFEARRPLSVLWMILTVLGLSKLRSASNTMIPISVLLVGLGGLYAMYSAGRDKRHLVLKHLEDAREQFRSEFNRAISDIQTSWRQLVNQFVGAQKEALQNYVDIVNRQAQSRDADYGTGQRSRYQAQIAGFDAREKRLSTMLGNVTSASSELRRIRADLKLHVAKNFH